MKLGAWQDSLQGRLPSSPRLAGRWLSSSQRRRLDAQPFACRARGRSGRRISGASEERSCAGAHPLHLVATMLHCTGSSRHNSSRLPASWNLSQPTLSQPWLPKNIGFGTTGPPGAVVKAARTRGSQPQQPFAPLPLDGVPSRCAAHGALACTAISSRPGLCLHEHGFPVHFNPLLLRFAHEGYGLPIHFHTLSITFPVILHLQSFFSTGFRASARCCTPSTPLPQLIFPGPVSRTVLARARRGCAVRAARLAELGDASLLSRASLPRCGSRTCPA